jgi:hypothetical protein
MGTQWITNRFRRVISLGVLALLAGSLLNLVVTPGISAAAESTQASVSPATGGPSTRFTFVADGFKGDPKDNDDDKHNDAELVSFWINTPDGHVIKAVRDGADADDDDASVVRASRAGQAELAWRAPSDALAGKYTLVAHGIESGYEAVIPFRIEGSARGVQITEPATVTPAAGTAGTRFTFAIYGFSGESDSADPELVSFWINTPDGHVIKAVRDGADADDNDASVVRASDAGKAELTWQAPLDAAAGKYTLVAHGIETEREQVIAFEIR